MKDVVNVETKMVSINELLPDPKQPRQQFEKEEMKKLKDSITQKGILNPLVVEPKKNGKYLIVDGERRYRTAKELKFNKVPANVLATSLPETERNIVRFQLQETHSHWSYFEKAEALNQLKIALGMTAQELAQALAISMVSVNRYLSILTFTPKIRKQLTEYKLPFVYIEVLSYTKNLLPAKLAQRNPHWIENIVDKYKRVNIKTHHDFRVINRLIRVGEYGVVEKFLKKNNYTAQNAKIESGDEKTILCEKIFSHARKLKNELETAKSNNIPLNKIVKTALNELAEIL